MAGGDSGRRFIGAPAGKTLAMTSCCEATVHGWGMIVAGRVRMSKVNGSRMALKPSAFWRHSPVRTSFEMLSMPSDMSPRKLPAGQAGHDEATACGVPRVSGLTWLALTWPGNRRPDERAHRSWGR